MNTTTQNHLTETAEIGDILSNRYRVLQIIKSGVETQVYLTEDISLLHDNVCLLKRYQYHSKQAHLFKLNKRLFETELNYLRLCEDWDQIPKLLDNFEDEYTLSLIEELIEGDLLSKLIPSNINSPNCWLELNILEFLSDILETLTYLNEKDIIHGDLNPNNIIQRKKDNRFCLIDFANVQKISELDNPFKRLLPFQSIRSISPSSYVAPEQIIGQTKANSDLYSLGIIAIQALTGIDISQLELSPKTQELNWLEIWQSHHQKEDFLISEEILLILNNLVCADYKNRYQTAKEAFKDVHNFIKKKTAQIIIFTEEQWPGLGFSPSYYFSEIIENNQENNEETDHNLEQEILALVNPDDLMTENAISTQELLEILEGNPEENLKKPKSNGLKIDHKWLSIIGGIGITGLLIYASVIYFGLGTILEVLGLNSNGKQLLKAQEIYESGNLQEAIAVAESIPQDSAVYEESQTIIKQWQLELEKGNQQLKQIEVAFEAKQWETVLQDAKKMPSNVIWQEQLNLLVTKAKENLDRESRKLLQQAINHAEAQEFGEALFYLKQIPLESSFGELVKTKLVEYEEKRDIRDYHNLQEAFNSAQKQDFLTAINFLQKISPDSEKGAIAQQKIIEYTQMQNIKNVMKQRQGSYDPITNFNPGIVLNEIHI